MRPLYTMHGGHQLYHIPTGKLITRHGKLHVIPTPQHIIDKINALGKKQNGSILKIESKYFPTWSAAVDEAEAEEEEAHEDETESVDDQDTYNSNDESDSDSDSDSDEDEDEDDNTLDTEDSTVQEEEAKAEIQQEADEPRDLIEQHPSDEPNPVLTTEEVIALEPETQEQNQELEEEQLNISHEDIEAPADFEGAQPLEGRVEEIDDQRKTSQVVSKTQRTTVCPS